MRERQPEIGKMFVTPHVARIVTAVCEGSVFFTEYEHKGERDNVPNRPGKACALLLSNWNTWEDMATTAKGKKRWGSAVTLRVTTYTSTLLVEDYEAASAVAGLKARVELQRLLEGSKFRVYLDEARPDWYPYTDEDLASLEAFGELDN